LLDARRTSTVPLRHAMVLGLALALPAGAGCELLGGIDERPDFEGGGQGGGTSSGTGGGDCPAAQPGCGPESAPVLQWPDSTRRCYGDKDPPCDYPGEDGDVAGTQGYTVEAETVTDTVTGLQWLKEASGPWSHADAVTVCQGTHANKLGWRLPKLLELLSLIDYGRVPLLHGDLALPEPYSQWAQEAGGNGDWHYYMMFHDYESWQLSAGELTWGGGPVTTAVRCVRGAPLTGTLTTVTECDGQLVRDSRTGLEWPLAPSSDLVAWTEALDGCAKLCDHGGGWRLASAKELATLYVASTNPGVMAPFDTVIGTASAEFWTSTPSPTVSGQAMAVDFAPDTAWTYSIRTEPAGTPLRGWCVRDYTVN
jgi:hypothetical protein